MPILTSYQLALICDSPFTLDPSSRIAQLSIDCDIFYDMAAFAAAFREFCVDLPSECVTCEEGTSDSCLLVVRVTEEQNRILSKYFTLRDPFFVPAQQHIIQKMVGDLADQKGGVVLSIQKEIHDLEDRLTTLRGELLCAQAVEEAIVDLKKTIDMYC